LKTGGLPLTDAPINLTSGVVEAKFIGTVIWSPCEPYAFDTSDNISAIPAVRTRFSCSSSYGSSAGCILCKPASRRLEACLLSHQDTKPQDVSVHLGVGCYFTISVMTPAPTVLPPSRMAKRWPVSRATGWRSSTVPVRVSPGMTISTPDGRVTVPVTSVVRK